VAELQRESSFFKAFSENAQKLGFATEPIKLLWHNGWNVLGDRHLDRALNKRSAAAAFST
jgi:hypothetical protein